jgi:deoxyribodipyrimidine photolyase-related protein
MEYFVILPTQLFSLTLLPEANEYIIWEHPHYFQKYNYNKKKLVLHRASMRCYFKSLGIKKKVKYVPFYKQFRYPTYSIFDPIDKIKLPGTANILENPGYLLSKEHYKKYRNKTDKYFFYFFYLWGKKEIGVLPGVKSTDKLNREKLPDTVKIPGIPDNTPDIEYINEANKYVNKYFPDNYGNIHNFIFPISHTTAKKWLRHFVSKKLNNFGPYQDAIVKENNTLFHSLLSTSINIGLLTPNQVIREVLKNKKAPINSREGFVRQLFWREYQRYCYIYIDWKGYNYFGNTKRLTKHWYDGTTGVEPVDVCITNAFDTGYLHHIERLMIVGNFMNVSEISPKQGFKWFMEFSCDSYEWVMCQNVYDMVFFVTGGLTMRRPYISSSNYILKNSNYTGGEWADVWDEMYHTFVRKHRKELHKFRYHFPTLTK